MSWEANISGANGFLQWEWVAFIPTPLNFFHMSPFQKGTRDQKDNSLASIHHFSDMWSFWRFRTFQPSELCWLRDLYHEKRASSYAHLYSFPGEWRHTGAEHSSKLLRWRSASGSWKSFWTRAIESCIYRLSSPWLQVFRDLLIEWIKGFLGK